MQQRGKRKWKSEEIDTFFEGVCYQQDRAAHRLLCVCVLVNSLYYVEWRKASTPCSFFYYVCMGVRRLPLNIEFFKRINRIFRLYVADLKILMLVTVDFRYYGFTGCMGNCKGIVEKKERILLPLEQSSTVYHSVSSRTKFWFPTERDLETSRDVP